MSRHVNSLSTRTTHYGYVGQRIAQSLLLPYQSEGTGQELVWPSAVWMKNIAWGTSLERNYSLTRPLPTTEEWTTRNVYCRRIRRCLIYNSVSSMIALCPQDRKLSSDEKQQPSAQSPEWLTVIGVFLIMSQLIKCMLEHGSTIKLRRNGWNL